MTVDKQEAVDAFESLGLTSYEAMVFIGLHRLGTGTARDVAETTDVPRSQVYAVAESLEQRGLIDVQQSSPRRFRPVPIEKARETLAKRFETHRDAAFDYVDKVSDEYEGREEQEAVWTIHGRDRITTRVADLIADADDRIVLFIKDPGFLTTEIGDRLAATAKQGVRMDIFSPNSNVRSQLESVPGANVMPYPGHLPEERGGGQLGLFIDDDGILLAVVDTDGTETGIWSSGTLLASVFIQLADFDRFTRD